MINSFADRGVAVLITTHYLEEAEQAESICIMNKGHIIAHGTPAQIKVAQEYVLIDAENRSALRTELTHLNLPFIETPYFKLSLNTETLHATLKTIETPLTSIQTYTPTLEDAYLEIIGEGHHGRK